MPEPLSEETIRDLIADLEGWEYANQHLVSNYKFRDFSEAMGFMVRVALVCETLHHHPNWYNVYNKVDVQLWTHDAGGVTGLDVKLARAMNEVAGRKV